jgi:peptidoglycan lytic transglycosylase
MLSAHRLLVLFGFGGAVPLLLVSCSESIGYKQMLSAMVPILPSPPPRQTKESSSRLEGYMIEQVGTASWYGPGFHGRKTASGETFNQNALTAAHRSLPLGTTVIVTNLETGKSVRVKINDRGPYVRGRKIDLSHAAAQRLEMKKKGVAKVKITAILPRMVTRKSARRVGNTGQTFAVQNGVAAR